MPHLGSFFARTKTKTNKNARKQNIFIFVKFFFSIFVADDLVVGIAVTFYMNQIPKIIPKNVYNGFLITLQTKITIMLITVLTVTLF